MIEGLVGLFLFQATGELVSRLLLPAIPGPVIGLVLLVGFLQLRGRVPESLDVVGSTILQHLGLLFVPASVGVVLYLPELEAHAWGVALALMSSVLATIAVTGLVLRAFDRKDTRSPSEHDVAR